MGKSFVEDENTSNEINSLIDWGNGEIYDNEDDNENTDQLLDEICAIERFDVNIINDIFDNLVAPSSAVTD